MNISIALCVYNGEKYLEKQLLSICNQELIPYEIVIVDDCSTDKSQEIIKMFDFRGIKCHYYRNNVNLGVVKAFKKAVTLCNGEFIATCDQDDIWLPNKLKISYAQIQKLDNSKPCVVFTDLTLINNLDEILKLSVYKDWRIRPWKYNLRLILFDNVMVGCTCFFNNHMKMSFIKMPDNAIMHDYWMCLIACTFGENLFIDESTILYRSHENSVTQKIHTSFKSKFIDEVSASKNYLKKNFDQVKMFLDIYDLELSLSDKKIMKNFLIMKNLPFFFKRVYAKVLKIYVNNI